MPAAAVRIASGMNTFLRVARWHQGTGQRMRDSVTAGKASQVAFGKVCWHYYHAPAVLKANQVPASKRTVYMWVRALPCNVYSYSAS